MYLKYLSRLSRFQLFQMTESVVQTEFVYTGYGKNYVKLLYLRRDGDIHFVKELEVSTELTLNSVKDYTHGDNSDIIATDSQKNTVYVMAKQYGVRKCKTDQSQTSIYAIA